MESGAYQTANLAGRERHGTRQSGAYGRSGLDRLVLTVEEVGAVLGMSRASAYKLVTNGTIPSMKIRGMRRVAVQALEAWVAAQATACHPGQ